MDEAKSDPLSEQVVREQALAYAAEAGWASPEEVQGSIANARGPAWANGERSDDQTNPAEHNFESLPIPGLTHRCAWCGNVKSKHTDEVIPLGKTMPEEVIPLKDNPQA